MPGSGARHHQRRRRGGRPGAGRGVDDACAPTNKVRAHGRPAAGRAGVGRGRAGLDRARTARCPGCCRIPPLRWLGPDRHRALPGPLAGLRVDRPRPHRPHRQRPSSLARLVVAVVGAVALQFAYEWARATGAGPAAPGAAGRSPPGRAGAVVMVVAVLAATLTRAGRRLHRLDRLPVQTAASTSTTTTLAAAAVPTVAFYGDALASTLEASAKSWAARTGKIKVVDGVASPTCGIDRDAGHPDATDGSAVPIPDRVQHLGHTSGPRPPPPASPTSPWWSPASASWPTIASRPTPPSPAPATRATTTSCCC